MRLTILGIESGKLMRGVAVGLIAGLGAGCSSDFSRFAPYDSSTYTGSVNQQQIIFKNRTASQPFPEDIPVASTQADMPVYTGSVRNGVIGTAPVQNAVRRTALAPVASAGAAVKKTAVKAKDTLLAPVTAARRAVTPEPLPLPDAAPVAVAAVKKKAAKASQAMLDDTVTGGVAPKRPALTPVEQPMPVAAVKPKKPAPAATGEPAQEGWSTIGGTWITVKEGETVYNLAKRFGVPANAILEANKLPDAAALKSGRKVIIPTYIYSSNAKISAPDANRDTQLANSSTGNITDVPVGKVPVPGKQPKHENLAVIPATPQLKTKQVAATTAAAPAAAKPKVGAATVASAAKPASAKAAPGSYTVASGDSLYSIAKKNGVSVDALKQANGLSDGKLKIGQALTVPKAGAVAKPVTVAAADPGVDPIITGSATTTPKKPTVAPVTAPGAAKPAVAVATPDQKVIDDAEKDTAAAPGATGISKLRWPVRGRTLTSFGQASAGSVNDGVDISVPVGTPVKAAENGVVIYAGTGLKDFGNTILIRHENGIVTVYGHNSDLQVKRGDTIKRGQEIARSGMSGNTKVPKLHFEVRQNSKPVNPATFLE